MPSPRRVSTALTALLGLLAGAASAAPLLWKPCTLQDLRQYSNLIVTGTIVEVVRGEPGPEAVDRARLRIDRVLRGWTPEDEVTLTFPGVARGRVNGAGELVPEENPAFIRYSVDQEGIFFLLERDDGTYSANHPARFKPLFFLSKVVAALDS